MLAYACVNVRERSMCMHVNDVTHAFQIRSDPSATWAMDGCNIVTQDAHVCSAKLTPAQLLADFVAF